MPLFFARNHAGAALGEAGYGIDRHARGATGNGGIDGARRDIDFARNDGRQNVDTLGEEAFLDLKIILRRQFLHVGNGPVMGELEIAEPDLVGGMSGCCSNERSSYQQVACQRLHDFLPKQVDPSTGHFESMQASCQNAPLLIYSCQVIGTYVFYRECGFSRFAGFHKPGKKLLEPGKKLPTFKGEGDTVQAPVSRKPGIKSSAGRCLDIWPPRDMEP